MTDDTVVPFKGKVATENSTTGTLEGHVKCLTCNHNWIGVAPVGTYFMECPACKSPSSGRFVNPVQYRDHYHWRCMCGNDMFCITPDFTYCPKCGKKHSDFDWKRTQ